MHIVSQSHGDIDCTCNKDAYHTLTLPSWDGDPDGNTTSISSFIISCTKYNIYVSRKEASRTDIHGCHVDQEDTSGCHGIHAKGINHRVDGTSEYV